MAVLVFEAEDDSVMYLVFLGAPGSGKGTQAKNLTRDYGLVQLSTGDMLRAAVKSGSHIGNRAKDVIDTGNLVSDEIVVGIVEDRIRQSDFQDGYLLDGFPRNLNQAKKLDKILQESSQTIDRVLEIRVDEEAVLRRIVGRRFHLASGRSYHVDFNPPKIQDRDDQTGEPLVQRDDDNEDTVWARLQTYSKQTAPLVEYYLTQNLLSSVDGMGSPEEVYDLIRESLLVFNSALNSCSRKAS